MLFLGRTPKPNCGIPVLFGDQIIYPSFSKKKLIWGTKKGTVGALIGEGFVWACLNIDLFPTRFSAFFSRSRHNLRPSLIVQYRPLQSAFPRKHQSTTFSPLTRVFQHSSHPPIHPRIHPPTHPLAHPPTHLPTQDSSHPPIHPLIHPPTPTIHPRFMITSVVPAAQRRLRGQPDRQ